MPTWTIILNCIMQVISQQSQKFRNAFWIIIGQDDLYQNKHL
jgi:hypothetical protein